MEKKSWADLDEEDADPILIPPELQARLSALDEQTKSLCFGAPEPNVVVPLDCWDESVQHPAPIVFLDVDGVLHSLDSCREDFFNPSCMRHLRRIIESTGACIVLSSTWRLDSGPASRVIEALKHADISIPIDATPDHVDSDSRGDARRAGEILAWVGENHHRMDRCRWVAIDDIPLNEHLCEDHVVVTDSSVGLTSDLADEAIQKLRKLSAQSITASCAMAPVPIIIDTDLGDDIDDTWALAMALNSPEVDVRFILTAGPGKHLERAAIAAKLLTAAGRTDIPIGLGCHPANWSGLDYEGLYQGKWIADFNLGAYAGEVHENGIKAMIDLIMAHEGNTLTIVAIAPLCNLAEALRVEPGIAPKCKFVGMHGSIDRGYFGAFDQVPEYNVIADTVSCRATLSANWKSKTLTPLDTCGLVILKDTFYQAVVQSSSCLARCVMESHRLWHTDLPDEHLQKRADPSKRSTVLFDCVAVFLAFSEQWLAPLQEHCTLVVTSQGYTHLLEPGEEIDFGNPIERVECNDIRLALNWSDLDAFHQDLAHRILRPNRTKL